MSVLIAQPSAFVKQSTAEETMGKQSATESSLFSEKMPQHIQCNDAGYYYHEDGIPPERKDYLQNNIVPEWDSCLFGENLVQKPLPGDKTPLACFSMMFMCERRWANDPSSNPVPWIDGMWEHIKTDIKTDELPVIQRKLGYFFCNYGVVSKGDIFPLAEELYYVEDCFSAIKVYPENISLPQDKNKGLCTLWLPVLVKLQVMQVFPIFLG